MAQNDLLSQVVDDFEHGVELTVLHSHFDNTPPLAPCLSLSRSSEDGVGGRNVESLNKVALYKIRACPGVNECPESLATHLHADPREVSVWCVYGFDGWL